MRENWKIDERERINNSRNRSDWRINEGNKSEVEERYK